MVRIRLARESDIPGILDIYGPYILHTPITFEYTVPTVADFTDRFRAITAVGPWLVAEEDGNLLGYAYLDRAFERVAYRWAADLSVYLRPEAAGKGLGRVFYTLLERMGAMQGYQVLYGLVTSENENSCRFHEAMGYRLTAVLPDCGYKLGRWHGVHWYEKRLCAPCDPGAFPKAAPDMDWSALCLDGVPDGWEVAL